MINLSNLPPVLYPIKLFSHDLQKCWHKPSQNIMDLCRLWQFTSKNIYSIGNDISQSHITTKCLTALFNLASFKLSPLQTKPSRELATFNFL